MTRYSSRPEQTAARHRTGSTGDRPRRRDLGEQRDEVIGIQRGRVISAAVDAVEEVGYARLTVGQVIRRARVSRKTFYDLFTDREDCFLAAFERALGEGREVASEAFERESGWLDGIRSGLASLLALMEREPGLARLFVVEAPAAGDLVLVRRAGVLAELTKLIDHGRSLAPATSQPPRLVAEGVVGAVLGVLHTRVLDTGEEPLADLLGSLMSIIVLPYLGAAAARRELTRDRPDHLRGVPSAPRAAHRDPLEGLNMRLTYRTVRVLMFIAEHPGASNRQIADGAEVEDQGQMSKLLSRLARLELVHNDGDGPKLGMANAWELTERGTRLERATRPRL
jgi:AcrR family transcriptional regulator